MKILFLIFLTSTIFCYDSSLLKYPEIAIQKKFLIDFLKTAYNTTGMPLNYGNVSGFLFFTGNIKFDIVPADDVYEELENNNLFPNENRLKDEILAKLLFSDREDVNTLSSSIGCSSESNCTYDVYRLQVNYVTIPKGKFAVYIAIKVTGQAQRYYKKIPFFKILKIKVCTPTMFIFKKCKEYTLEEATRATVQRLVYSNIEEYLKKLE